MYEVRNVSGEDFREGIKYEINLADGFMFDDGSSLAYAESVADLNVLINDIVPYTPIERDNAERN